MFKWGLTWQLLPLLVPQLCRWEFSLLGTVSLERVVLPQDINPKHATLLGNQCDVIRKLFLPGTERKTRKAAFYSDQMV